MQRIPLLLALCIIFYATSNFKPVFARINKEIKFIKLENTTDSNLELFIKDDNLKQNIETQPARLNLNFDASSLIKNSLYPTSFKIKIYDLRDSQRNLLGIFRPSIINPQKTKNFKTKLELLNLTQNSDLEIDIFDTNNNLHSSFKLNIQIDNGQTISFTDLTDSNCTASFGQCQLEYIFNNVHLTTLPSAKLQTKIEKNTDGTYTVNLPLFKAKTLNVRNKISSGTGSPNTDQDFNFDFDGSNLFVIKDGVKTLIGAQGPAGEKGDSGPSGAPGEPGSFSGGDATINGVLTFVSNGRLQDAFFNGASFVTTSNIAEVPFTIKGSNGQTANLTEWQNSLGTVVAAITSAGNCFTQDLNLDTAGARVATIRASYLAFNINGSTRWDFDYSGHFVPHTTGAYDIGTAGVPVRTGYFDSLRTSARSASAIPLIVKGATGQTANLTEWQNSNGQILASISNGSSGLDLNLIAPDYFSNKFAGINIKDGLGNTLIAIGGNSSPGPGIIVAEQIHKYGSALSFYGSSGINLRSASTINSGGEVGAANIPMIIKGSVGQTANLTEWQNSAGTVFARVESDGAIVSDYIHSNTQGRVFFGYLPGSRGMAIDDSGFYFKHIDSGRFEWSSTANVNSATDTGLTRSSAGVLEINNGASGQYRDLIVRNLGAGIPSPARKLHISEAMRIEPQPSPPTSPSMGDLYVDSDSGELCYYNGSVWTGMVAGGACS